MTTPGRLGERHGWASCPLTQNGFLRIVTQKSYLRPKGMADALAILTLATSRAEHVFWPDDVSVLNSTHVDHERIWFSSRTREFGDRDATPHRQQS